MTTRVLALDRDGRGGGASHASDLLDLGALAMPPVYGWLMDRGELRAVFVVAAGLMVLTILTVLEVRRQGMAARAQA